MLWESVENQIHCHVCPHECKIEPEQSGKCNVLFNRDNKLINDYYGQVGIIALEPIEKKPLFHFTPGCSYLSVGFRFCSLFCKFCQNFKISQSTDHPTKYFSPREIINLTRKKNATGIAFTFNEPTIHYQYLSDVAKIKEDLKIVVKTNGYALPDVWNQLNQVDAYNVDIKGDDKAYQEVCGGTLQPVLESIKYLHDQGKHVEISYLVLNEQLEDFEYHKYMRDFFVSVSKNMPIHLLSLYPVYKMQEITHQPEGLCPIRDFFKEEMSFVYISNVHSKEFLQFRDTLCPVCMSLMVSRHGSVKVYKSECCGISL